MLIGATIAAAALMIAHSLTHLYTANPDRRAELADAIDKAIAAFIAADRAALDLIQAVEGRKEEVSIIEKAAKQTDHEVAMRAAVLSVSIRLPVNSDLAAKLLQAHRVFFRISKEISPAAPLSTAADQVKEAVGRAHAPRDEFLTQLGQALELAREQMTGTRRWWRRQPSPGPSLETPDPPVLA